MPKFEIKKVLECTLIVDCKDESTATSWSELIVATLENDNGERVNSNAIDYFEADSTPAKIYQIE